MKSGWKYVKLGELVNIRTGKLDANAANEDGCYPFFTCAVEPLKINTYAYDCECVLIAGNGDLNVKYYNGKFNAYQRTYIIESKDKSVLFTPYLFRFYQLYIDVLRKQSVGSTIKYIKLGNLTDSIIPLPSLLEQGEIVAYLDKEFALIDALREKATQQLQATKDLFQTQLKQLLTPKQGWEEKKLGDACEIFGRIGFRGYTRKDLVGSHKEGAITLSPSNIQNYTMDYSSCSYIRWYKYEESPEIKIFNGDILLVKTGSSYGKSAIVENLPHPATINPQFVVLKNFRINNHFLAYLLRTNWIKKNFDTFVSGTAIPTFSQESLSKMIIHFPSLSEQGEIVRKLDALSEQCRQLEENYRQTISLCNDLKQAVLRQVFE